MNSLDLFHQLKTDILKEYQKAYPFWKGTLQDFGNKEIAQLQDLIEEKTKQRVSEKWVYTHLKPEDNIKLPREDMLDIFSIWLGYSGWDEFKVKKEEKTSKTKKGLTPVGKIILVVVLFLVILIVVLKLSMGSLTSNEYKVDFRDKYTQKVIEATNFSIYLVNDKDSLMQQKINEDYLQLNHENDQLHIKVESPYYRDETFLLTPNTGINTIYLQPDDYAMMLLVYMNSNLKDWEKRRKQLEEIILDDAEILEVMNEDIGVEFLNKEEFIDKLTIPIESTKRMEIIDIKYKGKGKIIELKFIQKNKDE